MSNPNCESVEFSFKLSVFASCIVRLQCQVHTHLVLLCLLDMLALCGCVTSLFASGDLLCSEVDFVWY